MLAQFVALGDESLMIRLFAPLMCDGSGGVSPRLGFRWVTEGPLTGPRSEHLPFDRASRNQVRVRAAFKFAEFRLEHFQAKWIPVFVKNIR